MSEDRHIVFLNRLNDGRMTGKQLIRMTFDDILSTWGRAEGNLIIKAAADRIKDPDGGTAIDWYAALQAAILERHPEADETSDRPN